MTEKNQATLLANTPPDVLLYGFGDGSQTLRSAYETFPDFFIWKVERSESELGHDIYSVMRFSPAMEDQGQPMTTWTIDANKGFLITGSKAYFDDGRLASERKIEVAEAAPGIWVPVQITDLRFPPSNQGVEDSGPIRTMRIHLKDVVVNVPFGEDAFKLEALGFPKETTQVIREFLDGRLETYVYRQGDVLIPVDLAVEMARLQKNILEGLDISEPLPQADAAAPQSPPQTVNAEPKEDEITGGERSSAPIIAGFLLAAIVSVTLILYIRRARRR